MPLIKSKSKEAFISNVKAELNAGKPRDQALAIAYDVKRRSFASGGVAPWYTRSEANRMTHSGPISSIVGGRTDHHPMSVTPGSYVLPADHVSSLGQGNTANGMTVLKAMFGAKMNLRHGAGAPKAPSPRADGGAAPVDIMAAGGEFVIPAEIVTEIGGGDIQKGHEILDDWVIQNRKKHIKTLKKLPGPAKT